jgi:hypothetical protein
MQSLPKKQTKKQIKTNTMVHADFLLEIQLGFRIKLVHIKFSLWESVWALENYCNNSRTI